MDSIRKTSIIVGALFLISYCGVFLGNAILAPIIDAPDFLLNIFTLAFGTSDANDFCEAHYQ